VVWAATAVAVTRSLGHGPIRVVRGVTVADRLDRSTGHELFLGELADRLQHAVAGVTTGLIGGDQRLAYQRLQPIEHGVVVEIRDELGSRSTVEATCEHRTMRQQHPFVLVEKVVRPAQCLSQGLMTFESPPSTRQPPEPVIEAVPEILRTHGNHAGRRQLDR